MTSTGSKLLQSAENLVVHNDANIKNKRQNSILLLKTKCRSMPEGSRLMVDDYSNHFKDLEF